jgi:hypothetical protein
MSTQADWKNPHLDTNNKASPSKCKNLDRGMDRKDRKYGELSSDILNNGHV